MEKGIGDNEMNVCIENEAIREIGEMDVVFIFDWDVYSRFPVSIYHTNNAIQFACIYFVIYLNG